MAALLLIHTLAFRPVKDFGLRLSDETFQGTDTSTYEDCFALTSGGALFY
jgi:hypothetical protein